MKRLALSLLALSILAGCGIKGDLERPGPMWNREEAVARDQARQAREREEEEQRRARAGHQTTPATIEPNPAPPPTTPTTPQ